MTGEPEHGCCAIASDGTMTARQKLDALHQVAESYLARLAENATRVPISRPAESGPIELLIAMHDVQVEILRELRELRAGLGSSAESRSSVAVESNSKGQNISIKAYVGSDVRPAGDAALGEFSRVMRELQERQMNGWAETVNQLAAAKGADANGG